MIIEITNQKKSAIVAIDTDSIYLKSVYGTCDDYPCIFYRVYNKNTDLPLVEITKQECRRILEEMAE